MKINSIQYVLGLFVFSLCGSVVEAHDVDQFFLKWTPTVSTEEKAVFNSVDKLPNTVAFAKDATFRGVVCTKGNTLGSTADSGDFVINGTQQGRKAGKCKYKEFEFIEGRFRRDGSPKHITTIVPEYGHPIELGFGFDDVIAKKLKNLGMGGKRFYAEYQSDPSKIGATVLLRDPATFKKNTLPVGTFVFIDSKEKKGKVIDSVAMIYMPEGTHFKYQGWPCTKLELREDFLSSCNVAEDFKYKSVNIPAKSSVNFYWAAGKLANPIFMKLSTAATINGTNYPEGAGLKFTKDGVTSNYTQEEAENMIERD